MKIGTEASKIPSFNFDQWHGASRQLWERHFLEDQTRYEPKEGGGSEENREGRTPQGLPKDLPQTSRSMPSQASLQARDATESPAYLLNQHHVSTRPGQGLLLPSSQESTSVHPLITTRSVMRPSPTERPVHSSQTTQSPPTAYNPSRGVLYKDQAGEATLWAGSVNETLFRKSLSSIQSYLEVFSIKLTRVFFRGKEVDFHTTTHQARQPSNIKQGVKNG